MPNDGTSIKPFSEPQTVQPVITSTVGLDYYQRYPRDKAITYKNIYGKDTKFLYYRSGKKAFRKQPSYPKGFK